MTVAQELGRWDLRSQAPAQKRTKGRKTRNQRLANMASFHSERAMP